MRINRKEIFLILLIVISLSSFGQRRSYQTMRIEGVPPLIDGKMDDKAWDQVEWGNHFTQMEPYEGEDPTQQTAFKVLYDDSYIYIMVNSSDNQASEIERRMSRRDDLEGDFVAIGIDSYNDERTSFTFFATAAGVKGDILISEDGQSEDETWDPIWYLKTSVTAKGWIAEMKIPLTQIRFSAAEEQTWGFQIMRQLFRKEESSTWQPMKLDDPGMVSRYGKISGIKGIKPQKQADVIPYITSKIDHYEKEKNNFFADGSDFGYNAGVDAKIGITNNLTLDLTVNPDFGQVEADPSEVNLSAFESYFQEKRPFFIEGRNILNFGINVGDGDFASDNLFYSRRIGRRPHFGVWDDDNFDEDHEYYKHPDNTKILGAMKLTGKTDKGWSIGVMESFTNKEVAKIGSREDSLREFVVEPYTNYFVGRVSKDFNKGNTIFGGMLTATNRQLDQSHLQNLHSAAYTGGLDLNHQWKDKKYYINARILFSHVAGDSLAILNTQQAPQRYFQRPDVDYVHVDSSRTSLTGTAGTVMMGKNGNKGLRYMAWVSWRSPMFETNDVGFIRNTDDINFIGWLGYRHTEPFSIFRTYGINANVWNGYDFSGTRIYTGGNINGHTQFSNYWRMGLGVNVQDRVISKATLRGGPQIMLPGTLNQWFSINSDQRKKLTFGYNMFHMQAFEDSKDMFDFGFSINYQPFKILNLSLHPSYTKYHDKMQWVTDAEFSDGNKYIMAEINQKTFMMAFRVNLSITPTFTVQYYGQPFMSTGKYKNYKWITTPMADKFEDRFLELQNGTEYITNSWEELEDGETVTYTDYIFDTDYNGEFSASERDNPIFGNPDFKFLEFKSNLVARWEYRPGSVIYLVWSENRQNLPEPENFHLANDMGKMFKPYPYDILMVKFSYRIPIH
ncbi:MAG: carbohydrate binding family 9 domain-containing protein [Bacteroidales bacterium]|nr:carbohydrate binding family 9 domain-containing protein [Bacteroidales bacterium]